MKKSAVAVLKSAMEAEEKKLATAEAKLARAHSDFVEVQEEREKAVAAAAYTLFVVVTHVQKYFVQLTMSHD